MSNVFQPSMVKLQVPRGFSRSISISGFTVDADASGHVVVPVHLKQLLINHGLTEVPMGEEPEAEAEESAPSQNGKARKKTS